MVVVKRVFSEHFERPLEKNW